MAEKKIGVNVKEARLLQQWLHTTIASVTWKDLINFIGHDMLILTKAAEELEKSELYNTVGDDIQKKAEELVETKCKPEWNRISEEIKTRGEKANTLEKEKASAEAWDETKQAPLDEANKKVADLTNEYQKVTDEANKELNEYKDERINQEQGAAFFLSEDDYKLVGGYCGF